jgi:hypothetical protein
VSLMPVSLSTRARLLWPWCTRFLSRLYPHPRYLVFVHWRSLAISLARDFSNLKHQVTR